MSQRYIGGLIYNPPGGFSGYFDGSGDSLTAANNAAFRIGSGDFTVEGWVLFPTAGGVQGIISQFNSGGTGPGWTIYKKTTDVIEFYGGSGTITVTGTIALTVGAWNHFAVVRNGSTITIYVNGVAGGTGTNSSFTDETTTALYIGARADGVPMTGYVSNARIVKGTAVYTANFTPPVGPLQAITNTSLLTCAYPTFRDGSSNNFTITVNGNTAVSTQNPFPQTQLPNPALGNQGNGVYSMSQYQALRSQNLWPAIDPYFDFVTLMLHGNGTNGAQNNTFLDSSTNNFTITRNGNTTQGTFTPYGSNWSNYFDGTGDYLSVADNTALTLTGDHTIEAFVYLTAYSANYSTVVARWQASGTQEEFLLWIGSTGTVEFYFRPFGAGTPLLSGGTVNRNSWTHIAVVRSGNDWALFVGGSRVATATNSGVYTDTAATLTIGSLRSTYTQYDLTGYISNVRLVKGTAVYSQSSTTLTVPTAPLTAITNTSLLTCADNRFIDDSSNNFTITPNGDVSVQRFSPFAPTTPYAAGTIGGSGYFDGSGDYLSVASSSTLAFGTGDFTIEGWYYPLAYSGDVNTITSTTTADSASFNAVNVNVHPDGSMQIGSLYSTGAGTVPLRAWTYFVVSRVSGTIRLFINGVERSSASNTTNYTSTGCLIGVRFSGSQYYGTAASYISGLKFTVGSGVTSVTVPSAPPTGGNLLTNFTNGGIIDNAMMNDLETVGNAQISTTQSKFGGASLYFDGTGDYLKYLGTNVAGLGSGNFTVEFWINAPLLNDKFIIALRNGMSGSPHITTGGYGGTTVGALRWATSAGEILSGTTVITDNTWHHCAIVRNGSTVTLYVDGISRGSGTDTTAFNGNGGQILIGENDPGSGASNPLTGYLDDFRITKGYARYTANFTPQRSQWQDQ